jgi:hypothetical protein
MTAVLEVGTPTATAAPASSGAGPVRVSRPSPREALLALLSRFTPTTVAELEAVALLDRTDTKYLLTTSQVTAALAALTDDYLVLEIDGARLHHYQTLYFDTADFALFRSHHAGRAVRHKVRSRAYVDTGLSFLEVKAKNNKGRTVKYRLRTDGLVTDLHPPAAPALVPVVAGTGASRASDLPPGITSFVASHAPVAAAALQPTLWNAFHRITLVGKRRAERVTIDLGLSFEADRYRVAELPGIAVAELKQPGGDRSSPFARQMRVAHVQPARMSKFCVGVSLLHPGVRHNAFKPTLRTLEKLMKEEAHVW